MNARKFGKIANQNQQPWKAPSPVFIEDIYFKRFQKKPYEQAFKSCADARLFAGKKVQWE